MKLYSINAVDVTGYPESALFHVRRSMPLDDFDCEERVLNDIVLEVCFSMYVINH